MLKGFARYATCRPASEDVQERRAEVCSRCPARVQYRTAMGDYYTCGEFAVERVTGDVEDRTCGCLVLAERTDAMVGLTITAAGKTECEKEVCPRGKW
jgi:hypothetical protein